MTKSHLTMLIEALIIAFAFIACNDSNPTNANNPYYAEYGFLSKEAKNAITKCLGADCAYNAVTRYPADGYEIIKKTGNRNDISVWMNSLGATRDDLNTIWKRVDLNGSALVVLYDNIRYFYITTNR